ncbi:alpha/beta fold hydrolase [Marinobacter sp. F4216]|uniref:alpha/beta fold hydrolase n=1 Tax=Marinobacter sp. F4216 TaxID=2874281 RepID=UPI001CC0B108|nr:alpha/beta fold hydrolase [Marinobacter sp. F4216]MBZ2168108.1 alpha/beta fold hydrolase [Marinobacter sp. F4216]
MNNVLHPTSIYPSAKHRYADVGGVNLHWLEVGNSDANPPLILLHGLNDCYITWKQITFEMSKDRRVLSPDLPGHGYSGRPDASYELQWYASIMAQWLDLLDIQQADFVGHSFGGGVAQMLIRECRHRIRRLALLSSGGLGREVAIGLRLASIPWLIEKLGQPFMSKGTLLVLWHPGNSLRRDHIAELSRINSQRGSARAFARTVADVINWRGQTRNFFQHAHEIPDMPPMGLFWGDHDRIIPVEHARALVEAVDGTLLKIFKGCGHFPHHECPQSVALAFQRFFDTPKSLAA